MKNANLLTAAALFLGLITFLPANARAKTAAEIDHEARAVLRQLVARDSGARALAHREFAVLVFPSIVKGGFVLAGQHGEGALISSDGRTLGYYKTTAASYGLQAGVKKFGYAMFFMNRESLSHLNRKGGWELGGAPGIVVVNKGMSGSLSTTKLTKGIYTFFFNQQGLMAGLGLQGSKITRFDPSH